MSIIKSHGSLIFKGSSEDWCSLLSKQGKVTKFLTSNIIFLDIKNRIYDIKSLLSDCFFIKTPENTTCSVFKPYEPLDKMSER